METTKVWNDFSELLRVYILSKVKNETTAEDILQEVFIKIHLNIDKVKKQESLKSWVYTIAKNSTIDYLNKQPKTANNSTILTNLSEEHQETHSHKDCVLPLVMKLPKKYRDAMLLSEIKGMKQAEVARQLQISLSGAKSRIQRGRILLKKGFVDCCDFKINEKGHLYGTEKTVEECKVCN